jgi:transcriptional regulator with XRE-family HTH domain
MKNRIKECRLQAGMTRDELGMKVGVSADAIRKWEVGERGISVSHVEQLATALDVIPAYLVGWSDKPTCQTMEQTAERCENKMHFYHVYSQHLPIDAVIIAESPQQAVSVALRHCYDWLPETAEKTFRSQLVAEEVQVEAGKWPRWIAGQEK